MKPAVLSFAPAALLLLTSLPAHSAALDNFTLTSGSDVATFTLPAAPSPSFAMSPNLFIMDGVSVTLDGTVYNANIVFFNSGSYGGGLDIVDSVLSTDLIDQKGPVLFSGSVNSPVFNLGNAAESVYVGGIPPVAHGVYQENFTVNIASASALTPEPSSLLLLGTGTAGVAGMLRRPRSRK